ncbi:hypothetical protein [Burkholderia ubonensis]|uniref:hypothetical protein n=1 Tax=Burkholderia ubonensis TaxID=101571 RepID=UPI000758A95E|nr:hypothetical protein [Burkholderia ubonensis]KVC93222.1 hypothetical protein WI76_27070 [Burkholderia ubonensis]KVU18251.1 hypothetical protein WK64_07620 [Burkholderia ubonensis]
MTKSVISPEEFIAEVNRRLPNHHAYEAGWRVFLYPEGADGATASGYDLEPRAAVGHIKQVIDHVNSLYTVDPNISRTAHD